MNIICLKKICEITLKPTYLFWIYFSFSTFIKSQTYSFINYSTDDGLPSNNIYSVVKDQNGYVWFSSNSGVGKFVTGSINVFSKSSGLPDNSVFTLIKNENNKSLLGTCYNNNLFSIDIESNKINIVNQVKSVIPFQNFFFDQTVIIGDTIFLSGGTDCYKVYKNNKVLKSSVDMNHDMVINFENQVPYIQSLKNFLSQNTNRPISIKVKFKNNLHTFFATNSKELLNYTHYRVHKVNPATIALTLGDRLLILNKNGAQKEIDFDKEIISLFVDNDNDCWIGLKKGGIHIFKKSNFNSTSTNLLGLNSVSSICQDDQNGIWASTLESGIYYCKSKKICSIPTNESISSGINAMNSDGNYIYVSSNDNTIYSFDIKNNSIKNKWFIDEINTRKIICKNNITLINGRIKSYVIKHGDKIELNKMNLQLRDYVFDKSDSIIGIYQAGLVNLGKQFDVFSVNIIGVNAYSLAKCENDKIIVGCDNGLYEYKNRALIPYFKNNLLLNSRVDYLFYDNKERLWIVINGSTILIKDKNETRLLKINTEMEIFKIRSIVESNDTYWIGTNKGLLNLEELNFDKKNSYTCKSRLFTKFDGLLSNDITTLIKQHNVLFIANSKGLNYLNMKDDFSSQTSKPITFNLTIGNSKVDSLTNLELLHNFNSIKIKLQQPYYYAFSKPKFYYKINGLDCTIVNSDLITLSNLKPGKYTLQIANFYDPSAKCSLIFTILKPIWYRTWFIISEALGVILLLVFLFSRRLKNARVKDEEELRIQKIINDYKITSLQAQMNPHFIFNALNSIQQFILTKKPNEAYDYLARFSKLIRLVLESSRQSYITLANEIEMLKLYMDIEQQRTGNSFTYTISYNKDIDINTITLPVMIIQPHIENCIWHGITNLKDRVGVINLKFIETENHLVIEITDNGVGRKKAFELDGGGINQHPSLSMKINEERLKLFNSKFQIIDLGSIENPLGTKVIIYLTKNDE